MAVRGDAQVHGSLQLIVAPARCHRPAPRSRLWGVSAQLYGVRSQRNWGMGDFTDLADLTERAAALGASAVGVNPLHALFPADANHISPYSPSSRLFLNVFYLDPAAVPDLAESSEARAMLADGGFRRELENARAADLVDYLAVWRLKLRVLELLFASFQRRHLAASTERALAFRAFCAEMGQALEQHAVFDALHEHALATGGAWSWHDWPASLRRPDTAEVAAFAREHRGRVDFFAYLQWLADQQLAAVQGRARAAGMPIGLYQDIAVGVSPASAMAWANPGVTLSGVSAGAPPDWFNLGGQNWGLAPLSPVGLREGAYAVFARDAAPQHASCGRRAPRSRDGVAAPVLDPRRRRAGRGRLCALPVRRPRRGDRARIGAPSLRGDRGGPGHGAARLSAGDAARRHDVVPGALLRARRGRRVCPARGLSAPGPGLGVDPRSADAAGLLDLARCQMARAAWTLP